MRHYFSKLSRLKVVQTVQASNYHVISEMIKKRSTRLNDIIDPKVKNIKPKLLYSDYIEQRSLKMGFENNVKIRAKLRYKFRQEDLQMERQTPNMSVALKYLVDESLDNSKNNNFEEEVMDEDHSKMYKPIHMPYSSIDKYNKVPVKPLKEIYTNDSGLCERYKSLYEKYLELAKMRRENIYGQVSDEELNLRLDDDLSNVPPTWMTDYETYNDAMLEDPGEVSYGTPNRDIEVSSIPCGGCGALLHCQDVAIPGYLPSELFINRTDEDLKSITCQRCHFMKTYNTCLDVRISSEDYPKLLEQIQYSGKSAVILLVDLTDFPCSVWPDISSIIGEERHVYVVGNKIDLLPKDSPQFLNHVKDCLTESMIQVGIVKSNIKHIGLISAKTGFGVEELINKLHKIWNYRGDLYLVGCTNAGKSTLFNTLLQSDLCKSQAVDLVRRATTSPWPGTTLNLLKFPLLKASGHRLFLRTKRLQEQRKLSHQEALQREEELKRTRNIELATLQSCIVHSFKEDMELGQAFNKANGSDTIVIEKPAKFGLDENADEYKYSRWCYDTPGTIQPDQILHLLTTEELLKTLPDKIISPRTFCINANQTIFIAGLGRLDILDIASFIRCTVFASNKLPITICKTEDAEYVYNELIKTEAFAVPINNPDRLKMWPEFKPKNLEAIGIGKSESVSDVVLSSAGWIAVTAQENQVVPMRAWTPEGRGIYLRTPALLPRSVKLRGDRRIGTPAYKLGHQVFVKKRSSV